MNKNRVFGIAVAALLWSAFLFGAGWMGRSLLAGGESPRRPPAPTLYPATTNPLLDEVWGHVRESFVGAIPSDTVRNYGIIRGALSSLNDRWTILVEPQPRAVEKDHMRGQFGGIGVDIRVDDFGHIVMTPHKDSPAQKAGILPGDILIGIDDLDLPDKPDLNEVAAHVRGDPGTAVHIRVLRADQRMEFVVNRANIDVPSTDWHIITDTIKPGFFIGYIGIHQFTERTGAEVKQALSELKQAGSQAYLIDLRDNGGGLLNAAVDVTSRFLNDGVVLYERKHDQADVAFPVTRDSAAGAYREPIVVLINGNTASASEIVAGAIQDTGRGKLIGEKSFGKGSVQSIYDLSDGSSVHITSAKWLTPNKRTIDGVGLTPDIVVVRAANEANDGKDSQLDRAMAALREQK